MPATYPSEGLRAADRSACHKAERTLAERTRYLVDDQAAQRFLAALEQPPAGTARGLRRLTAKPSVLPRA